MTAPAPVEEQIAFLTRLASSPDRAIADTARRALLTKGWQDQLRVDSGAHGGEWTAQTTTSKTPQRAAAERAAADAKDRAESATQLAGMDAADREADRAAAAAGKRSGSAVADARRAYGIPSDLAKLSKKRRAAAQALLDATADVARVQRRRAGLQARLGRVREQLGRTGLGNRTRRVLDGRSTTLQRQLAAADTEQADAQRRLAAARSAWGAKGSKKSAAVPDVVKGVDRHGRVHMPAGSREGGRYARMALGDMLGVVGPGKHPHAGHYGSHRIPGRRGSNPVDVVLRRWDTENDPDIGLATSGAAPSTDTDASLTAPAARQVADHLRDLVTIGRSGRRPAPAPGPKSKQRRTVEQIQHLIANGDVDRDDQLLFNADHDGLPLTFGDLLDMLAEHAPGLDEQMAQRRVFSPFDNDSADVYMRLDTAGDEPVVLLSSRESSSRLWDPTGEGEDADYDRKNTAVLSLDDADDLANVLDRFAVGYEEWLERLERDERKMRALDELQAQGRDVAVRTDTGPDGDDWELVVDGEVYEVD